MNKKPLSSREPYTTPGVSEPAQARQIAATTIILILFTLLYGASTFNRNGAWQDKKSLWYDVLEKNPYNARGHIYLGTMYAKENRLREAKVHFTKAILLEPNIIDVIYNSAIFFLQLGDEVEAEKLLKRTISLRPRSITPYIVLSDIYSGRGDFNKSITVLEEALRIKPDHFKVLPKIGMAYISKGRTLEAEEAFKKMALFFPNDPLVRSDLGNIYLLNKKYGLAVREYEASLALSKESPAILYNLGIANENMKRYGEALRYYELFVNSAPRSSYKDNLDRAKNRIAALRGLILLE